MMAARRILLVEDEAPIRQMFAFNLTRAGFDVDEAEACSSARTLIADSPPDLVLVDWRQVSFIETPVSPSVKIAMNCCSVNRFFMSVFSFENGLY